MIRIVVITDAHANLPALKASLAVIHATGYDAIIHTGDAIAIGPYPAECLDLLLNTRNVWFVKGNHEVYFAEGLPEPRPAWLSAGEAQHQQWTHAQLDPQLRPVIAKWPYVIEREFEGVKTTFMHYGLGPSGQTFQPLIRKASAAKLDRMFASCKAEVVFYGHNHDESDVEGRARYINPGSLGCNSRGVARYCVIEYRRGRYKVQHRSAHYEQAKLFKAFEQRNVPEREFICRIFFGRQLMAPHSSDHGDEPTNGHNNHPTVRSRTRRPDRRS